MTRPSPRDLDDRLAGLSPAKRALLEKRLQSRGLDSGRNAPISRREGRTQAPLSFAQQRLWFLDQLERGSASYNVPSAVRLKGPLDVNALERSLDEIVRRHATLRTRFPELDGEPVQLIDEDSSVRMPLTDLTGTPEDLRDAEVERLVRAEALRPFDLAAGPVFRAGLIRVRPEEHVFLCTLHHIVSDGWSRGILFRELAVLYEAFASGRQADLEPLPFQYADYAEWQQEWLKSDEMTSQLDYWLAQFDGELPVLELPTDHPRPSVQTLRGDRRDFVISSEIQRGLKALCREEGATLFMAVLAAFDLLLHRYTGQTDIVVGSLTANRNRVETENLIGIFINAVAMRTDLSGDPSFRELLRRVKEVALGAYAHEDLPFEKLVEALHPDRDMSRPPVYQAMLNVGTGPARTLRLDGLVSEDVFVPHETALLDLTLTVRDREGGLSASLEYNADLFEPETIGRMVDGFQTLLQGALARPEAKLSTIPVMSEADRRRTLVDWNRNDRDYPLDHCFHELFERQVDRKPDAVAVRFAGESLSYRELNRRANRLARVLRRRHIGSDAVVGLMFERGADLLVAILAVFKAGGAYLPLDPAYPVERVREIFARSGLRLVLTSPSLAQLVRDAAEAGAEGAPDVIELDRPSWEGEDGENLPCAAGPGNLAYVIFTSGSTGVPKGAMIEHRGMLNHLFAKIDDLELTASDTVAEVASQCFDISVWQFLAALLVGGRVVVYGDEIAHDPDRLLEHLEQDGVSILEVVPSFLRAMLQTRAGASPSELSRLRWMIATGEALPAALAREWLAAHPAIPLLNAYGPTECSDDVTHHALRVPPPPDAVNVPIGRAIANTRLYVLDRCLSPVPLGVVGELYVGGAGVGRGYLNDAGRTAEVFLPDPFSDSDGARLYKTGDLARMRSNGVIEFLGRIDHQVKVRGFRIELGEIEAALAACAGVSEAVCLAREDGGTEKRLVAYVVAERGRTLEPREIRAALKRTLPEYMVPSAFVFLESLPLTANGKLDRRRLPAPEESHDRAASYVAPRIEVEELLAGIWGRLLGLERVSVFDDFFEMGGHSLLVTQVISRIRAAFKVELPLRTVFEMPTVAALAARIEASLRSGESLAAPPLSAVPRGEALPLSFAQQRLWFFDQVVPGSSAYNIRRAARIRGPLDSGALRRSLQAIVNRHEVLRTSFGAQDGRPTLVMDSPPPTLELPLTDLGARPATEREVEAVKLLIEEMETPFDLRRAPLMRAVLLRMGDDDHILGLTIHHIVSDLWSLGVLFEELSILYEAFIAQRAPLLPELPIQYADYALWQRQALQGALLEQQLGYWRGQLAGVPELISLPTDRPRPLARTFRGGRKKMAMPAPLAKGLKDLSRRESATLYMTLLAGFAALLGSYSGEEDVVVGSPVAGRNHVEVEPLIGFFLNTLVLRSDLSGDPEFRELIGRVRETALGAFAHQDLPFEKLVEELKPARSLSHNPLFQVWFVLQNAPAEDARLAGAALESVELPTTTTRHDLQLTLSENEAGLLGHVDYSSDLFDDGTIEGIVEDFQVLLGRVAVRPEERLSVLREALAGARKDRDERRQEELVRHSRRILKTAKRKAIVG